MPRLFDEMVKKDAAGAYPMVEYWTDIGNLSELQKARNEYSSNF
jgi:NDP-sugar pyrophosphorylase family protein